MANSDNELDAMKRFPLQDVLAGLGYVMHPRKSSRHSLYMVHPETKSKLVVSLNTNGHYRFFPIGSSSKGGTVFDALALVMGYNIGQARRHMRPLLNGSPAVSAQHDPRTRTLALEPITADAAEVLREFNQVSRRITDGFHPYLNDERMLTPNILCKPQFAGAIFTDAIHGNALFPHRDTGGIVVGAEIRNRGFQGQLKHGRKTLWYATPGQEERKSLLIAEAAIDAISYAALHYCPNTCYMSTGGTLSPHQRGLIASAIAKLPKASGMVTLAVDNDEPGDAMANTLKSLFDAAYRDDLHLKLHQPPKRGDDWNDHLLNDLPVSSCPS